MSDIGYRPVLPDGWPRPRGFSHGVVATGASQVRIAGQVGTAPGQSGVEAGLDFGTQWARALANVAAVVRAAGGAPGHLVALRVYVTRIADFHAHGAAIGAAWMESLGKHFPAMTLVQVSGLLDPNAVVEIEADAVLP
ncbi:MAG TPA: Rid family hydrolase [Burkholderiaceae bacterium]|nr:Rid family hydrolase [Burkholderiaceae bacterium]